MDIKGKILLNPGPTNTRYSTKLAQMTGSDVCHRTEEFYSILEETKRLLLKRFTGIADSIMAEKDWHVAIIGGSGTTAMEAMIAGLALNNSNVTVINAGTYGKRISEILNVYDIKHEVVSANNQDELSPRKEKGQLFFVENEVRIKPSEKSFPRKPLNC